MTAPTVEAAPVFFSGDSGSGLTVSFLAGSGAARLCVIVLAEYASGGSPATPDGWARYGGNGLWVFTKYDPVGGGAFNVTFPAFNDPGGPKNVAYTYALLGATGVDVISGVAKTTATKMTAPSIFTDVNDTLIHTVFAAKPREYTSLPGGTLASAAATDLMGLIIHSQTRATPGKTTLVTIPGDGTLNWRAATVAFRGNQAPNAPGLLAPADATYLDTSSDNVFTWGFSDPDSTDVQAGYSFQLDDLTAVTSATATGVTADERHTVPAGTLIDGHHYQWRVATTDGADVSAWTAYRSFIALDPPAAPTITDPADDDTIITPSAPITVAGIPPAVPGGAHEVRRLLAGSLDVLEDISKHAGEPATTTFTLDSTGHDEIWQARVNNGVWSAWTSITVHIAFTPPPTPELSAATNNTQGKIVLTYATAAGDPPEVDGGHPDAVSVSIYRSTDGGVTSERVASELPTSGEWTFWTPASGVDYLFSAVAVAADGATAASDWVEIATIDPGDGDAVDDIIDGGGP